MQASSLEPVNCCFENTYVKLWSKAVALVGTQNQASPLGPKTQLQYKTKSIPTPPIQPNGPRYVSQVQCVKLFTLGSESKRANLVQRQLNMTLHELRGVSLKVSTRVAFDASQHQMPLLHINNLNPNITIFVNLRLFRHFETVINIRTWIKSHRYWRML